MDDMNWRDKDDLDLTSEDISAMATEGELVTVRGPRLPGNGVLVSIPTTYNPTTLLRPDVHRAPGQLVGTAPTRTAAAL